MSEALVTHEKHLRHPRRLGAACPCATTEFEGVVDGRYTVDYGAVWM
jgi:hypothetical protein